MCTAWWILTNVNIHVTLLKPSYGTCPSGHQVSSCPFAVYSIPLFSQPQDKTDRPPVTLVLLTVELCLKESWKTDFWVWPLWFTVMSSRLIDVTACINCLLFLLLSIISLYEYTRKSLSISLMTDIWVVSSLAIANKLLWIFSNKSFSGLKFWINTLKWS